LRGIDFGSWPSVLSTLLGLAVVTLVMIGVRLLVMPQVQQRRERANRRSTSVCVR
jgi:glucose uptake protein GlcU